MITEVIIERDYNGHKCGIMHWETNAVEPGKGTLLWATYLDGEGRLTMHLNDARGMGKLPPFFRKYAKVIAEVLRHQFYRT